MDGGAWPFLVGGVICLVDSDNERDSSLLTSVQWLKRSGIYFHTLLVVVFLKRPTYSMNFALLLL